MKYEYTHFIPENVAPKWATRIVVKRDGEEVCSIPGSQFGSLTPPAGKPLYSFGLVSDCHTFSSATSWNGNAKLKNALAYFNAQNNCVMVIGCGDFTQTGFYRRNDSTTKTITVTGTTVMPNRPDFTVAPLATYYDENQIYKHSEILEESDIPVFEIFGNHENYNGVAITAETTIEGVVYKSLVRAQELTGIPHTAYTVSNEADSDTVDGETIRPNRRKSVEDDLFILVGQSEGSFPMSESDLGWLENTLKANTHRRCFIFIHSFIDDNWGDKTTKQRDEERPAEDEDGFILSDSGNPCGARGNAIFGTWEDKEDYRQTLVSFLDILRQYPNAVIFHGHSHMKFESQEFDKCANYTDKNGFKSVHVPSLGSPRTLLDTDGNWTTDKGPDKWTEPSSQCYRVDVYEDCIVLNGLSFSGANATPVSLGTYKIEV